MHSFEAKENSKGRHSARGTDQGVLVAYKSNYNEQGISSRDVLSIKPLSRTNELKSYQLWVDCTVNAVKHHRIVLATIPILLVM